MKTKYKYIHFEIVRRLPKTNVWNIYNNRSGSVLGGIAWYPAWREYCFYAKEGSIYNTDCLADVRDFIKQLMEERKK